MLYGKIDSVSVLDSLCKWESAFLFHFIFLDTMNVNIGTEFIWITVEPVANSF
jgi:hypothetical protein